MIEVVKEQRPRLVSLPSLCARVRLLLDVFAHEGAFRGNPSYWDSVGNLLLPPASVSRIVTNASVADLYGASDYCSSAADYDDAQSDALDD